MSRSLRFVLLTALVLSPWCLCAQPAPTPVGHWQGAIQVQPRDVNFEVDLARNPKGELSATFSNPGERIKGLPLAHVAVDGRSVRFVLEASSGGGAFAGVLSDDGASITGTFTTGTPRGDVALPFTLTRAGDAQIDTPAPSAPISKALEGAWAGSMDVGGTERKIVMTLVNRPDGTSGGTIGMADGGATIPITTITQQGASLTLDVRIVGGSFKGTVSADGTEVVGEWMQGTNAFPLTLRRSPKP